MKRGTYLTHQKSILLSSLTQMKEPCFSIDEFMSELSIQDRKVGKTTVYRFFEHMIEEGRMIKIPAPDGIRNQYQFLDPENNHSSGKLICLSCGKAIVLQCKHLTAVSDHIQADHKFKVNLIYGYCEHCMKE